MKTPTKTRVDRASQTGTGIHPLPPGAIATDARRGTQGRVASPISWAATFYFSLFFTPDSEG
jgi:hypothetical protein